MVRVDSYREPAEYGGSFTSLIKPLNMASVAGTVYILQKGLVMGLDYIKIIPLFLKDEVRGKGECQVSEKRYEG